MLYLTAFHTNISDMDKQRIYIETSIVSYLAARRSTNLLAVTWQELSWKFWEDHRSKFELFTSELVVSEAAAGHPDASERRLNFLRGIPELPLTDSARELAEVILSEGVLPENAGIDALHIAIATVHHMDLLLTWNCRHIDNPVIKPIVRTLCAKHGHHCPEICTPLELTEGLSNE